MWCVPKASNHGFGRASANSKRLLTILSFPCVNHFVSQHGKKLRCVYLFEELSFLNVNVPFVVMAIIHL